MTKKVNNKNKEIKLKNQLMQSSIRKINLPNPNSGFHLKKIRMGSSEFTINSPDFEVKNSDSSIESLEKALKEDVFSELNNNGEDKEQ